MTDLHRAIANDFLTLFYQELYWYRKGFFLTHRIINFSDKSNLDNSVVVAKQAIYDANMEAIKLEVLINDLVRGLKYND